MEQGFKDRSGALIAMGIFEIIGGVLMALLTVLTGCLLLAPTTDQPTVSMIPAISIYAALAVWLVTMGIGTIRAKRWARALMLAGSWFALVTGIGTMIVLATTLPALFDHPKMNHEAVLIALIVTGVILGLIYLIFPLIGILFYSGRNVRATCEQRNPAICWTDRCPLPVLPLSLLMFMGVFSCLTQVATNFTHPFFGTLLSGTLGLGAWIVSGLFSALIAVGLYKLKPAAWWGAVVYYAVFSLSSILTFSRITMDEFITAANYTEAMMEQISNMSWMNEVWLINVSLLYVVPVLIYLLFIKRYFEPPKSEEHTYD